MTPVVGLLDTCLPRKLASTRGWFLGVKGQGQDGVSDARFVFHLQTDRAFLPSSVIAHTRYRPLIWHHVILTYDEHYMRLYVNGALVAAGRGQRAAVFSGEEMKKDCRQLLVGGGVADEQTYRGAVDELLVWRTVLSPADVIKVMATRIPGVTPRSEDLVLSEHFDHLDRWRLLATKSLHHIANDLSDVHWHDWRPLVPQCGFTICDDPLLASSYVRHWYLRQKKEVITHYYYMIVTSYLQYMEWQHNCLYLVFQVRYRVINLADDKGDDAVVTLSHIHQQHDAVRQAFRPYNITWLLDIIQVNNTFLRHRHVLVTCEPHQVGNGYCEDDCRHSMTYDDAGDCNITHIACDVSRLGNGQCDVECNRARHHWDGGDCCDKLSRDIWPTCLDPGSSVRYITFFK